MAELEHVGEVSFFSCGLPGGGVVYYSLPLAAGGELDISFPVSVPEGARRRVLQAVRLIVSEFRLGPVDG